LLKVLMPGMPAGVSTRGTPFVPFPGLLECCHDSAFTHIGYVQPSGVSTPSRSTTATGNPGISRITTILFQALVRLQGFSLTRHRLDSGPFLGFIPFSAITVRRDRDDSNRLAVRPQVFSTSRQTFRPRQLAGLFRPAGTRRVRVFRV
jgi:hypothetical protein